MARYMRLFAVTDIVETHELFARTDAACDIVNAADRRAGRPPRAVATQKELSRAYRDFTRDLNRAAHLGARTGTREIVARIESTALRAPTDKAVHLKDLIRSRPASVGTRLATGAVGIADMDWLDKAIDPDYPHKGPYWAAQEYGTTKHVKRKIQGFFHGGGQPAERPLGMYSGGGGPHTAFSPASKFNPSSGQGSRGGKGGKGTIRVPLKPRYFIRDGANAAHAEWKTAIFAAQARAMRAVPATVIAPSGAPVRVPRRR